MRKTQEKEFRRKLRQVNAIHCEKNKRLTIPQKYNQLAVITEMYLKGYTYDDIAGMLDVARRKIVNIIADASKEWHEKYLCNITKHKNRILEKLALLQKELWIDYDLSCHKTVNGNQLRVQGDNKYLNSILLCIEKEIKITGAESPKQIELGTTDADRQAAMDRVNALIDKRANAKAIDMVEVKPVEALPAPEDTKH